MKWLVTGGCGFIGRALASHLLGAEGHMIRVLDNLSVGTRADLARLGSFLEVAPGDGRQWNPGVVLMVGDILDRGLLEKAAMGADVVVHLAANTGVGPSVENPERDCLTNVFGTLNALEAARAAGVGRFVFASSGAPLGIQTPPLHEEMAPHPASPYGASKLAGEGYCSAYFHSFGIETVALRFGNVYGEGSSRKGSLVAKFIRRALNGQQLEIFGDGGQTRDFIHVSDLVDAILSAATTANVGGECFQIATARETTVREITELLCDVLEEEGLTRPSVVFGEKRTGDVLRNYSDTRKAEVLLGWKSKVLLRDGLRRTVRYFLESADVVENAT